MLIDPKDPAKRYRDYLNELELREVNRTMQLCKQDGAPAEMLSLMLDQNRNNFNRHREEFRKRGILV